MAEVMGANSSATGGGVVADPAGGGQRGSRCRGPHRLSQGARRPSAAGVAGGGLGRRSRLRVAGARARRGGGQQRTGGGDGEMPATWRACGARPSRCIARDSDTGTAVTWARAAGGSLRWRCAWLPFIARLCEHGVRDGQSGPEGVGRMARLRALAAAASIASMVFTVGWALPASAGTGTGASAYSKPTWWQKFLTVSAPGFQPLPGPGKTGSVLVGSNIDMSNEPGPQSETSIAVNPASPGQIVAGSNEIFRLPMRGYFSSDGGKTWGGVDLPLPPPIGTNGVDFGSDPTLAFDTHGNVFYAYIVVFFNQGFDAITGTEMAVARSSDAGHTWTSTYFNFNSGSGKFNDKPYIAVDTNPASPFRDTVYAAWDNASLNN